MKRVPLTVLMLAVLGVAACRSDRSAPPALEPGTQARTDANPTVEVPSWAKVAPEQIAEAKRCSVPVAFENDLGMRFVLIPAGTFVRGWPHDQPSPSTDRAHQVTLTRPFFMQTTEVTNRQFRRMRQQHHVPDGRDGPEQPVVNVYWRDAASFAAWASARDPEREYELPTEAQWEMACRAGTTTLFAFGSTLTADDANINDSYGFIDSRPEPPRIYKGTGVDRRHTLAVGTLRHNRWGLFDMHGNAWEFCRDFFGAYPGTAVVDPAGPGDGNAHVIRGGGVGFVPWFAASPSRAGFKIDDRSDDTGFRLVSPLPEPGDGGCRR